MSPAPPRLLFLSPIVPARSGSGLAERDEATARTRNAFDAAEKNGRAADLQKELVTLFENQNQSPTPGTTSIPATFLRVTVRA